MVLLTVLQEPSLGPLVSRAAGRPCLLRPLRVGCRLPAHSVALGEAYSSTYSASGAAGNCQSADRSGLPGGHRFGQHSVQGGVNWTMSSATGRLSALWFRELQGGPACYRPFRVGCRPPALSTALVQFYSQCFRSYQQLQVCRQVWSPWRASFWPTLSTAKCQQGNVPLYIYELFGVEVRERRAPTIVQRVVARPPPLPFLR